MDDNYIINKVIDILNNENKNLLVGNITSPRPGTICQVSTPYGIKSAYNINCNYPGQAIVIWDKDEQQYYCFTNKPSRTISTRQLSFRKNREQSKAVPVENLVKILYKSTNGTTVKICVGGCYQVPKVLYTYETTDTKQINDSQIDAYGTKPDEWIVGFKEQDTTLTNSILLGKFIVYQSNTTPKYISPKVYVIANNKGRGYFEVSTLGIFLSPLVPLEDDVSFNNGYETFTCTKTPPNDYNATSVKNYPNFIEGTVVNTTMSGVAIKSGGVNTSGILSILGVVTGMYTGTGTTVSYDGTSKSIRSIFPSSFGSLDGIPINMETYQTILVGNKKQYLYYYGYNHNISIFSPQVPLIIYANSDSYGIKQLVSIDFIRLKFTSWINNNFLVCSLNSTNILGSGIKETEIQKYQLQPDGGIVNKPNVKAKYYGIPSDGTIDILSASYYLED